MSETAELSHNGAVGKGPPVCSGKVPSQAGRLTDSAPSPLTTWGLHTLSKQRCWNLDVKNGDVSGNPAIMAEGRFSMGLKSSDYCLCHFPPSEQGGAGGGNATLDFGTAGGCLP